MLTPHNERCFIWMATKCCEVHCDVDTREVYSDIDQKMMNIKPNEKGS